MKPNYLDMFEHLAKWEGGLSRDPDDKASEYPCPFSHGGKKGWHTNKGVTWRTFEAAAKLMGWPLSNGDRFFNLTDEDAQLIFKVLYWDKVDGDNYLSQAISNIFTQWAWGSGVGGYDRVNKRWVGALGLARDYLRSKGYTVEKFVQVRIAINAEITKSGAKQIFEEIMTFRKNFLISISKPGSKNERFRNGWMNRHNEFYTFNLSRI